MVFHTSPADVGAQLVERDERGIKWSANLEPRLLFVRNDGRAILAVDVQLKRRGGAIGGACRVPSLVELRILCGSKYLHGCTVDNDHLAFLHQF
jgi:hypothetical protein